MDLTAKPEEIISDEEIERIHGHANFGSVSKRSVVDEAVLKTSCGYHTGGTARSIIIEHGLAKSQNDPNKVPKLTAKGRLYLWSAFSRRM